MPSLQQLATPPHPPDPHRHHNQRPESRGDQHAKDEEASEQTLPEAGFEDAGEGGEEGFGEGEGPDFGVGGVGWGGSGREVGNGFFICIEVGV